MVQKFLTREQKETAQKKTGLTVQQSAATRGGGQILTPILQQFTQDQYAGGGTVNRNLDKTSLDFGATAPLPTEGTRTGQQKMILNKGGSLKKGAIIPAPPSPKGTVQQLERPSFSVTGGIPGRLETSTEAPRGTQMQGAGVLSPAEQMRRQLNTQLREEQDKLKRQQQQRDTARVSTTLQKKGLQGQDYTADSLMAGVTQTSGGLTGLSDDPTIRQLQSAFNRADRMNDKYAQQSILREYQKAIESDPEYQAQLAEDERIQQEEADQLNQEAEQIDTKVQQAEEQRQTEEQQAIEKQISSRPRQQTTPQQEALPEGVIEVPSIGGGTTTQLNTQNLMGGMGQFSQQSINNALQNYAQSPQQDRFQQFQDLYGQFDQQQRQQDAFRMEMQNQFTNSQRDQIKQTADAQASELQAQADDQIAESERVKKERIDQSIRELSAAGKFTTDASGNRTTDAIALLDEIKAKAEKAHQDRIKSIQQNLRSSMVQINTQRDQNILAVNEQWMQQQDSLLAQQQTRSDEFNKLLLTETLKKPESDEYVISGDSKNGFVVLNKRTGEVRPATSLGGGGVGSSGKEFADLSEPEKAAVFQLGKMVFGTRISDTEGARILDYLNDPAVKGKSRYELSMRLLGYTPEKNQELGEELMTRLEPYVGEDGLPEFPLIILGRLLDKDKKKEAIEQVENFVINKAKIQMGDDFITEKSVRTANRRAIEITELIDALKASGIENTIDPVTGTIQDWIGGFKSKDAQKVQTKISQILAAILPEIVGTAATGGEKRLYEGLIPQLGETAENFMVKVDNLRNESLAAYNDQRMSFMLPPLGENSLHDKNKKVGLYESQDEANQTSDEELDEIILKGQSQPEKKNDKMSNPIQGSVETASPIKLEESKVRKIIQDNFAPDQIENALKVTWGESAWISNNVGRNKNKTADIGLFQINEIHLPRIKETFGYTREDLLDPIKNAKVAAWLYNEQGWTLWVAARKLGIK